MFGLEKVLQEATENTCPEFMLFVFYPFIIVCFYCAVIVLYNLIVSEIFPLLRGWLEKKKLYRYFLKIPRIFLSF